MQQLHPFGRFVVLDFETTASPTGHRPVEIAALLIENGELTGRLECLLNPHVPIDPFSEAVHGIQDRDVRNAPTFLQVWPELSSLIDNSVVVAHFATFDSQVLRNELARHDLLPPPLEWWCTCRFARAVWPKTMYGGSYKLAVLAQWLELEGTCTHRSGDDAELALQLLISLIGEARERRLPESKIRSMAMFKSERCWPYPTRPPAQAAVGRSRI